MFTFTDSSLVPNVTVGVFIGMAFLWGWLSDGPLRGRRYPFIYAGAIINVRVPWTRFSGLRSVLIYDCS